MQNNDNIKIKNCQINIDNQAFVKISRQGNDYLEITHTMREQQGTVKKIDKDNYLVIKTGEVKSYNKDKEKTKTNDNLKKTFARLRELIRNNFSKNSKNQLFITLTYKENMTDEKRLMKDFENFYKRLKRYMKGHKLDYLAVAEPQGRGAWHFHLMLKSDQEELYIDNIEMERLWRQGYTQTERLKSNDVGSYYVAYFTDILEENKNKNDKKRIKGSRLQYYPKGFRFYRKSKGIVEPKENIEYYDIEKLEKNGYEKVFEKGYEIVIEDKQTTHIVNRIKKEVWKRVHKGQKPKNVYKKRVKNRKEKG